MDTVVHRYVALGDSTTEGLEDPYPGTLEYRGWADRLAERLAAVNPQLRYANLAIRGRKLGQIRSEQLAPAIAMKPDLASVVGGVNDVLRPRADVEALADELDGMVRALRGAGADVLLMTYPDFGETMFTARPVRRRLASFNGHIRAIAAAHRARLMDLDRVGPMDPRLFHPDRLHANPLGHERIALAAAATLGLPGADDAWQHPLPPLAPTSRLAMLREDTQWARAHLAPWIGRRLRGVSSGDGRTPKRPELAPFAEAAEPAAS